MEDPSTTPVYNPTTMNAVDHEINIKDDDEAGLTEQETTISSPTPSKFFLKTFYGILMLISTVSVCFYNCGLVGTTKSHN